MESTASIEQFREELQSWKHELSSIKQEIRHFEKHLEQLSTKRLPKELLAQVEHFQNQFICQKEVIDQLRHDLPDSGYKVENIFNHLRSGKRWSSIGAMQDENEVMTEGLEERMDTFRRIYIEIKQDFHQFDAEWM
ncbi:MAG: hypothetical protein Q8927_14485 [Bacteroidota bacterium]|nr:hypothetical protein [Bacteroidota bacterium]MDP4217407.1 hypothetical protein [Bacteroidota bacterium]MDP4245859.1 hypothetical protein [Bacteroidota bacterium]MDP4253235.1 hypothetical protein [Bacteroidota bacterium]MDP4257405.1 hypothetical protein [Bacteroidota bacterium]